MGFLVLLWIVSGFLSKWVFWLCYEFLLYFFQMGFLVHYGFLFCIFQMGSLAQPYDEALLCFFPNWFFSGKVKQTSFSCSEERIHQHWCLLVLCMQLLKLFLRQSCHSVPHEQSKSIPVSSQNVWLFVQCPQLDPLIHWIHDKKLTHSLSVSQNSCISVDGQVCSPIQTLTSSKALWMQVGFLLLEGESDWACGWTYGCCPQTVTYTLAPLVP